MTLAEFLLARIAEDEAVARAALGMEAMRQDAPPRSYVRTGDGTVIFSSDRPASPDVFDAWEHLWNWNPARVLAECEAKRQILRRREHGLQSMTAHSNSGNGAAVHSMTGVLKDLASAYSDHPDYLAEWKP